MALPAAANQRRGGVPRPPARGPLLGAALPAWRPGRARTGFGAAGQRRDEPPGAQPAMVRGAEPTDIPYRCRASRPRDPAPELGAFSPRRLPACGRSGPAGGAARPADGPARHPPSAEFPSGPWGPGSGERPAAGRAVPAGPGTARRRGPGVPAAGGKRNCEAACSYRSAPAAPAVTRRPRPWAAALPHRRPLLPASALARPCVLPQRAVLAPGIASPGREPTVPPPGSSRPGSGEGAGGGVISGLSLPAIWAEALSTAFVLRGP